MFDTFQSRLELTGILETVTALRISAGRSTEPIGADLPVIKDAFERPFIPGASFKGALRSRLESFLRGIDPSLAEDPADFTSRDRNRFIQQLKEDFKGDDAGFTNALTSTKDLAALLFGTPWIASKFQVRDLTVDTDTWFGQYQERDGVAIDRDTETAAEGKLYDFQVVPAGTRFHFQVVVENAKPKELGLLMIGLHQFEIERIPLGGGRSRGLGVVKLSLNQMQWFAVEPKDGTSAKQRLLDYLQHLVEGQMQHYQLSESEFATLRQEWVTSLITYLQQCLPSPNETTATEV
jgi:CRISPR-associated RAMP protein (TIGR02581 family)